MYQIVNYYHENHQKILNYKLQSRFLWEDHISYTRNAIVSILSNLPDGEAVGQRLLKNQKDIGTFISPYYSTQDVSHFVDLLKQHIVIAVDVVEGKTGAEAHWRMNGRDIVNYMQQMNRVFWPTSVTDPMWTKHLDLTIAQVDARTNSLWQQDIDAYDSNHDHMSKFADLFANGVVYQNMDKFCLSMTGV